MQERVGSPFTTTAKINIAPVGVALSSADDFDARLAPAYDQRMARALYLPPPQQQKQNWSSTGENLGSSASAATATAPVKRSPTRAKSLVSAAAARHARAALRERDHSPHSDASSSSDEIDHPQPLTIADRRAPHRSSTASTATVRDDGRTRPMTVPVAQPVVVQAMTLPLDFPIPHPRSTVSSPGLPSPSSDPILGDTPHAVKDLPRRPRSASPMSLTASSSSSSLSSSASGSHSLSGSASGSVLSPRPQHRISLSQSAIPAFPPLVANRHRSRSATRRTRTRAMTVSSHHHHHYHNHSKRAGQSLSNPSGMGRKVADSLQLFRETSTSKLDSSSTSGDRRGAENPSSSFGVVAVTSDSSEYVVKSAEVVRTGSISLANGRRPSISISPSVGAGPPTRSSRGKSQSQNTAANTIQERHPDDEPGHDEEEEEIGTVFVKRQEWPDREARAARRLGSIATNSTMTPTTNITSSGLLAASTLATPSAPTSASASVNTNVQATSSSAAFPRRDSEDFHHSSHLHHHHDDNEGGKNVNGASEAVWRNDGDRGRFMERELRLRERGNTIVGNSQTAVAVGGGQRGSIQSNHDATRIEREVGSPEVVGSSSSASFPCELSLGPTAYILLAFHWLVGRAFSFNWVRLSSFFGSLVYSIRVRTAAASGVFSSFRLVEDQSELVLRT